MCVYIPILSLYCLYVPLRHELNLNTIPSHTSALQNDVWTNVDTFLPCCLLFSMPCLQYFMLSWKLLATLIVVVLYWVTEIITLQFCHLRILWFFTEYQDVWRTIDVFVISFFSLLVYVPDDHSVILIRKQYLWSQGECMLHIVCLLRNIAPLTNTPFHLPRSIWYSIPPPHQLYQLQSQWILVFFSSLFPSVVLPCLHNPQKMISLLT